MITQLAAAAVSNSGFALVLALVALAVGRKAKRPRLVHLLWVLVLAKLVAPPWIWLPTRFIPLTLATVSTQEALKLPTSRVGVLTTSTGSLLAQARAAWAWSSVWLAVAWLVGSVAVLVASLFRVLRFHRRLRVCADEPPIELLQAAVDIAARLELKRIPKLSTTNANVSPMVWWIGGRVRVIIPSILLQQLEPREWRWVLAHELAHVHRRDHVVRWLEWLSVVVLWWHPIVWWAQRKLRTVEEICCDDLVMSRLKAEPRTYAAAILTAIESLAIPTPRPPAMASNMSRGGSLEWRMRRMIANHTVGAESRWLRRCVWVAAGLFLPVGVVSYAQDYEAVGKRLEAAVEADELSGPQARFMLGALRLAESFEQSPEARITRKKYDAAEAKMKGMVERGEAATEDVQIRLREMRRMMADQTRERGGGREIDWDAIQQRVEGAVERGDLTRAEADDKYREIKAKINDRRQRLGQKERAEPKFTREQLLEAEAILKVLDESDQASVKDAVRERRAEFRRMLDAAGDASEDHVEWEQIKQRIEGAVERGDLTRQQANEKYAAIKRRMAGKDTREPATTDWGRIKKRIESAVERGDLTREEANEKYGELKRRLPEKKREEPGKLGWELIERRIEESVHRGELTREQADATYRALRK